MDTFTLRIVATVAVLIVAGVFVVYWPVISAKVAALLDRPGRIVDHHAEQALKTPLYYRYWLTRGDGPAVEVSEAEYEIAAMVAEVGGTLDDSGLTYIARDGVRVVGFALLSTTPPQVSAVMPGVDPEPTSLYRRGWNEDDVLAMVRSIGVEPQP